MHETTLFLAQIFGPMLLFIGLGMLLNSDLYAQVIKDFTSPTANLMVTDMAMIAVGIMIVTKHFMWGSLPEILVTFIGLGFLIKGAMFGIMPKVFEKIVKAIWSRSLLVVGASIWVVGGAYLSYVGFLA